MSEILETGGASVLWRPLSESARVLLDVIWGCVVTGGPAIEGRWPVWSELEDEVYALHPDFPDLDVVYQSVPALALPTSMHSNPYGLLWHSQMGRLPGPRDTVGLSIAGLARLSEGRPAASIAVEEMLGVISELSRVQSRRHARGVVGDDDEHELAQFTHGLRSPRQGRPYAISDDVFGELLRREYNAPVHAYSVIGGPWTVHLRGHGLRWYASVSTWDDYFKLISRNEAQRERERQEVATPDQAAVPTQTVINVSGASSKIAVHSGIGDQANVWELDFHAPAIADVLQDVLKRLDQLDLTESAKAEGQSEIESLVDELTREPVVASKVRTRLSRIGGILTAYVVAINTGIVSGVSDGTRELVAKLIDGLWR